LRLKNLISFGFYQSYDQLKDIMTPLITALDDHRSGVWHKNINMERSSDTKDDGKFKFMTRLFSMIQRFLAVFYSIISRLFYIFGYIFKIFYFDKKERRNISKGLDLRKFDNGKGSDAKSKKIDISWEQRFLHLYNNTVLGMIFVLSIVLVNIILSIVTLFIEEPNFVNVDLSFSLYFVVELSLRLYCNKRVYGSFSTFFQSFFNCVDAGLVAIDWILFFVLDSSIGNAVQAVKGLRALRLLRLFRLMRTGRLMRKMATEAMRGPWVLPTKYGSISDEESETIVNILKILSIIYARIQEKRLGILIKAFVKWCDDNMNENRDIDSAIKYYFNVMNSEKDLLDDVAPHFNELLLDIMMYSNSNLLQEALDLLMVHNCNTLLLMTTAKNVQIIYSKRFHMCQASVYMYLFVGLFQVRVHSNCQPFRQKGHTQF
jgi:hypothetical protein